MERQTRDIHRRVLVSVVGALLLATTVIVSPVGTRPAQAAGVAYAVGDVFAGTGSGQIKHFNSTGTLLDTLDTTSASFEDTGMCFEASGNLISTNWTAGNTSKFDNAGNLVTAVWAGPYSVHPESCVVDAVGNIYVGEVDGANKIHKFNSAGTELFTTNALATQARGVDWIDLASDQCTMLYTSEGSSVKSFNVCSNTQNPDFATGLAGPCYALRIRSNAEVMVTCTAQAYRLSPAGAVLQTYPIAVFSDELFAMNLDPDGTSFWTGAYGSGNVYKVDIATGAGTSAPVFNAAPSTTLAGLAVFGEITAATAAISLTPADATNPAGTDHTVTAHVTSGGAPLADQLVTFSVTGQNAGATGTCVPASCKTDSTGDVTFTYHDTNGAGDDVITASFTDTTGTLQSATAKKHWTTSAGNTLSALSDAHLWLGLKNSDDQGTQFDVKVELFRNAESTPIASGMTRCVTSLTRNPTFAKDVVVAWDAFTPVSLASGDVLSIVISTRIGTTSTNAKCPGPGGSHNNARGLRLYYDSVSRASGFDMTVDSVNADQYLHSDGGLCDKPAATQESQGVLNRWFDSTPPSATAARCKDSSNINFAGGNLFSKVGTWTKP